MDFKAGFEDSARGNITSLDWIVVIVDPTIAAIEMAGNMKEMVDLLKAGALPATAHLEYPELIELACQMYREANVKGVLFVLNKVRDSPTEQFLRDRLAEKEIQPVGVIHDAPTISMAWLMGKSLIKSSAEKEAELIIQAIETIDNTYTHSEGLVRDLQAAF